MIGCKNRKQFYKIVSFLLQAVIVFSCFNFLGMAPQKVYAAQQTITLYPTEDTLVNDTSVTTNYGVSSYFSVKGSSKGFSYIKFNLRDPQLTGKRIDKVDFQLSTRNNTGTNFAASTTEVYYFTNDSWVEGTGGIPVTPAEGVTYSNRPSEAVYKADKLWTLTLANAPRKTNYNTSSAGTLDMMGDGLTSKLTKVSKDENETGDGILSLFLMDANPVGYVEYAPRTDANATYKPKLTLTVTDITPPAFQSALVSGRNKVISLNYDKNIYSNVADVKSAVYFAPDGVNFANLTVSDSVYVDSYNSKLAITFLNPISGTTNKIKINPNTIMDSNGNIISTQLITEPIAADPNVDYIAPNYVSATIGNANREVVLTFNEPILMNTTLINGINLARDGSTFAPLSVSDSVYISGSKLVVTFATALTGSSSKIKVLANTLGDVNYNILDTDIITNPIVPVDFTPPVYMGYDVSKDNRQIAFNFNEDIKSNVASAKNAISLAINGSIFLPLSVSDSVYIAGSKLIVDFASELTGKNNKINILSGTIADISGNVFTTANNYSSNLSPATLTPKIETWIWENNFFTLGKPIFTDQLTGSAITALSANQQVKAEISLLNNLDVESSITTAFALFDQNDSIKDFKTVSKQILAGSSDVAYANFDMPGDTTGYHIRIFALDSLSGMKPLYKPITFPTISEGLIFEGDFENGDLSPWDSYTEYAYPLSTAYSVQLLHTPARGGEYAARFNLFDKDPDVSGKKRSEINVFDVAMDGKEYWYGFSIYLPNSYQSDSSFEILGQFHEKPDTALGEDWRSPQFSFSTEAGAWKFQNRSDPKPKTLLNDPRPEGTINSQNLGSYTKGAWTDFVIHAKWSHKLDGILQVWTNGQLKYDGSGPNAYNDQISNYFKIGIYKPPFTDGANHTSISEVDHRYIYVDEVRMGGENSSYDEVAPEKAAQVITKPTLSDIKIDMGDGNGFVDLQNFSPNTFDYEKRVAYGATTPPTADKILAIKSDANTSVTTKVYSYPDEFIKNGVNYDAINFPVGMVGQAIIEVSKVGDNGETVKSSYVIIFLKGKLQLSSLDYIINGVTTSIPSFSPDTYTYNVTLPAGTTDSPTLVGTVNPPDSTSTQTYPDRVPGNAKIRLTKGTDTATYNVNFFVSIGNLEIKPKLAVSSVTCSSTDVPDNSPFNTLDSKLDTRWTSIAAQGEWIKYDLGSVSTVSYLQVAFYKGDVRNTTIDVEVSADGINWTKVVDHVKSSGITTNFEYFVLNAPTPARYVKVTGFGNTANNYNSITEVEIHGN